MHERLGNTHRAECLALALRVVRFDDTLVALRGSTHLKLVCGDPGPRAVRVAPLPLPVSVNDVVGVDTFHIFDEGSRYEVVGEIQHETGLV